MQTAVGADGHKDRRPSILIVDPDADTRLLYRTLLADMATTIAEAEDGLEALRTAVCQQPDVILTETYLRRIDGFALCRYLRRERLTRSSAIVVVTSAAAATDVAKAARCGADEVLVKPFDLDALVEATVRSWRRRQAMDGGADGDRRGTPD